MDDKKNMDENEKKDTPPKTEKSGPTMAEPNAEAAAPEGKVADADLHDVDGGTFTPTYDRSKPRKGTHLYDGE